MNVPRVGVGVMIVKDECVLMGRRMSGQRPGWWGWIGGRLEFGETLQECARREAREEAGVEVGNLRLLCISSIVVEDQHWIDVEFLGDIISGEPYVAAPDELTEWAWFPLDQLPSPIFEPAVCALKSYQTGIVVNE
ncbi:MAG TPA: NUDIX domain-containing protein [Anaerolineae bacterium]|nr:NUDIX domain-containing protein [Anaerolineae bacterium]